MPAFIDENQQFIDPDTSAPIVNGNVFFGEQGADPEGNPINVFAERELTTIIAQPVKTDASGRTTQKVWIPGRYSFEVTNSEDVQKLIDLDAGATEAVGITVLTNVVGADDITASADPVLTALVNGEQFTFTAVAINTANMTLDIDGLGAKPIKFNFNEQMAPGFIQKDQTVNLTYNSTEDAFFWGNEGRGISLLTNVGGTGDAITADGGPSVTGYVDKQIFIFRAKSVNSGAATLKIGTLPVISIKKNNDVELQAGEIQINQDVIVVFNSVLSGGTFQVISQLANQFTIQSKMCIPFFDVIANIPAGYLLCDGTNGTPNLVSRFIKGSDSTGSDIGTLGGSTTTGSHTLTISEMPDHNHSFTAPSLLRTPEGDNGPTVVRTTIAATTGNTGGGAGHTHPDTEPPFTNVLWIMKT